MIVSLHLQAAIGQRAGVGRYLHTLTPLLAERRGSDRLLGFYFDFRRKGCPFPAEMVEARAVRWVPGALVQQAWKRLGFPAYTRFAPAADVHHFPNFIIPPLPRGPKAVVTIHDLGFLKVPETLEPKNLAYLRRRMGETVARADRILTISETMAAELREAFRLPSEKVRATLLGAPPALDRGAVDVRRELKLDRPYLLHVGTLEPRKNHLFLVKLLERLEHFDGDLVLCGMAGWRNEPILRAFQESPRAARIRHLDYVTDAQLAGLYQDAEALLFPSLYEGFGLPPVEAMRQGCPVLSSDRGSLPEVVGGGGRVLPLELDAWVAALERLLASPAERESLIAAGRRRGMDFSWGRCADETWQVYRELAP